MMDRTQDSGGCGRRGTRTKAEEAGYKTLKQREVSGLQLRLQFRLGAISAPELHAYRTPAHYVYAHKLHAHEMAAYKIHAYGIHAPKVYTNKMRP